MRLIYLSFTILLILGFLSCKNDPITSIYGYHAHIHSPSTDAKQLGDTLAIEVAFESHTGETVHHINVRIYNKSSLTEVYNMPSDPHVDEPSGLYTFTDAFILSAANGLSEGDWVLEASVWGHEDFVEQVTEKVEFHINP